MKIVICGSMSFAKKIVEVTDKLLDLGHKVHLPPNVRKYASGMKPSETRSESIKNKVEKDLIRKYYQWIKEADVVLIVNEDKNDIKNYIGGNAFIEMAFGYVLNKKIYLLNSIPEVSYKDEIIAMKPIVIDSDLEKIK